MNALDEAEQAMLELYVERAQLRDGQEVLDLGCGWGSLSLFLAERFPASRVLGVSNSHSQREHIMAEAARRRLRNLRILTCDVNELVLPAKRFDRIEMLEHVRNYTEASEGGEQWIVHHLRWTRAYDLDHMQSEPIR